MPTSTDLQKRVLVVDDSRFVRTTFAHILKVSFDVAEAADGEAAWLAIQADPSIVMVFTDLDMPKLDGFGLLAPHAQVRRRAHQGAAGGGDLGQRGADQQAARARPRRQ